MADSPNTLRDDASEQAGDHPVGSPVSASSTDSEEDALTCTAAKHQTSSHASPGAQRPQVSKVDELCHDYQAALTEHWDSFSAILEAARSDLQEIEKIDGSRRTQRYKDRWLELKGKSHDATPIMHIHFECNRAEQLADYLDDKVNAIQLARLKELVEGTEDLCATLVETLLHPDDIASMTVESSEIHPDTGTNEGANAPSSPATDALLRLFRQSAISRRRLGGTELLRQAILRGDRPMDLARLDGGEDLSTYQNAADKTKWGLLINQDTATGNWHATFKASVCAMPEYRPEYDSVVHINNQKVERTFPANQRLRLKRLTVSTDKMGLGKLSDAVEVVIKTALDSYEDYKEKLELGCAALVIGVSSLALEEPTTDHTAATHVAGLMPNTAGIRKLDDIADCEGVTLLCTERLPRMVLELFTEIGQELSSAHNAAKAQLQLITQSGQVPNEITSLVRDALEWTERAMNVSVHHHHLQGIIYSVSPESYKDLEKDDHFHTDLVARVGPVWTAYTNSNWKEVRKREEVAAHLDKEMKAHLSQSSKDRAVWVNKAREIGGIKQSEVDVFKADPVLHSLASELQDLIKKKSSQEQPAGSLV